MNKLIKGFGLMLVFCLGVAAQNTTGNNTDEYKKNEYYVGYAHQQVDADDYLSFNGVQASYVRNVSRYFGIKGDFSATFKNSDYRFDNTIFSQNYTLTGASTSSRFNFLGGVQIKDNASKARFKPFAHALVGVGHQRFKSKNVRCTGPGCANILVPGDFTTYDTGFSGAFGGGLDIRINDRLDFRAIQVDYNPIYSNSRVENNVRFGIGFVIK